MYVISTTSAKTSKTGFVAQIFLDIEKDGSKKLLSTLIGPFSSASVFEHKELADEMCDLLNKDRTGPLGLGYVVREKASIV